MTILIVNNYSKKEYVNRVDQIACALKKTGKSQCEIWSFFEINEKEISDDVEAIILSGSTAHLQNQSHLSMYTGEIEFVKQVEVPVLGICFGHQLIGKAYGSQIHALPRFIPGFKPITILEPNEIFSSWSRGEEIVLTQSHQDYLTNLPEDFVWLATSETCKIEAIKHVRKPVYGVQAHVERASKKNSDGWQVLKNFVSNVISEKL